MTTLTEFELLGLKSQCNLADGHAYHDLAPSQLAIVNRLPEIWHRAAAKRHARAEEDFRDAFIALSRCAALENYPHFRICPTASNSIDTAAAYCKEKNFVVGMVEPTFDNLALLMRRRGVPLVPVAEENLAHPPEHIDALVVVNPNNPTGTTLTRAQFARLVGWCATRGKLLILDNTFRFFERNDYDMYRILFDSGVDFISIEDTGKVWPTQDLKASLIFASENIAPAVGVIYEETYLCVSNFALELLGEFLRDAAVRGLEAAIWHEVAVRRARFRNAIAGTDLLPVAPDSKLSVEWVTTLGGNDLDWMARLGELGLVALPGRHFFWSGRGGEETTRYLRFSLLKPAATFERALQILEGARDVVSLRA